MRFDPPNLNGVKKIIFDCETTGVHWPVDEVAGFVVCWGPDRGQSLYAPIRHEGGGNLPKEAVIKWLGDLAARPDLRWIGHSLKFDLHMGENDGIRPTGPVECTQVNAALIDENASHYNLDDVAKRNGLPAKVGDPLYRRLAEKCGGDADRKTQIGRISKLRGDDPVVIDYATGDGTTTWLLQETQQPEIERQGLRPIWEIECKVVRVLQKMERRGVRVDLEALAWLQTWLSAQLFAASKRLPAGFNVRSGPQIEKLFTDAGIKNFKRTPASPTHPAGQPSFVESWLEQYPIGRDILAVRRLSNLENSFINPILKEHIVGGLIHTNYNQLKQDEYGVVTGRLSSNGPNMQQVPKRNKILAPLFRMIFKAPTKGHGWDANDYSQQEPRIFTSYIGNAMLIDGYNRVPPMDMHAMVAEMLKVERDPTAKRMNMGIISGMGVDKLARSVGTPDARDQYFQWHAKIPEAKQVSKSAENLAKQRGWVRTKLFRRRRFPDWRYAYKAFNSVIQGTAADMTKLKMVEIDEYFESVKSGCHLMLQVHDELNWAVAPGQEHHSDRAREIMQSFGPGEKIEFPIPMPVDHHSGSDWGRASFPSFNFEEAMSGK